MTPRNLDFDQDEFFQVLRNRLVDRFPNIHYFVKFLNQLGGPEREKWGNDRPMNSMELARALTIEIPPLQRVLTFSMWMSRDFVRNVAGITDAELEEIEGKVVTPDRIYPAYAVTIEQWNTHTVICPDLAAHGFGRQKTIYEPRPWDDLGDTHLVWFHTFGEKIDGPSKGGNLEVVFHGRAIKCWARHGRFGGYPWTDDAEDKYLFMTIPLNEDKLNEFLVRDEHDSADPECRGVCEPWEHRYHYEDEVKGIGWELGIQDNIARAIDWS